MIGKIEQRPKYRLLILFLILSVHSQVLSGSHHAAHAFGAYSAILCVCSGEDCALNCRVCLCVTHSVSCLVVGQAAFSNSATPVSNRADVLVSIFLTPVEVGIRKVGTEISIYLSFGSESRGE